MKRREFCKTAALVPASGAILPLSQLAEATEPAETASAQQASSASTGARTLFTQRPTANGVPDFAQYWRESDFDGIGPDGKQIPGFRSTRTGAAATKTSHDPSEPSQGMELTQEEQDILDGKQGEAKAKVLLTIKRHGELFGATKLVDLGGNPHTSMFTGNAFLGPFLKIFTQCADEGLKAYAPYTINPRPADLYNVQTSQKMELMMFEGLPLQQDVDHLHTRLGGVSRAEQSCMCYLPQVGNRPEKGTYVAWGESSAINAINSMFGVRTNRNAAGMDVLCALVGKAPYFGLMTDEGRKAKWLIEVKTSSPPQWGVLGGAIGEKCIEDVPYITGIAQYFNNELTPENLHMLKEMGAATASAGAVGLYHVEDLTPEAKELGRDLLVEGYQTYVIDDAELQRVYDTYPNPWPEGVTKPTAAYIGCPHNTYEELEIWGNAIHKAMKDAGKEQVAIPAAFMVARVVSDAFFLKNPELYRDLYAMGVRYSNTCVVCFAGMAGFDEDNHVVTNSNKARKYSPSRFVPKMEDMVNIIVTGEMPA
jgi:predicted aconitase